MNTSTSRSSLLVDIRYFILGLILLPLAAQSGDLDSPAAPDATASAMYTLQDICNRLDSGTTGTKRGAGFVEPASGPTTGTGCTLDQIMGKAPAPDNSNGTTPAGVQSGKTYWGLRSDGTWGEQTGSMTNVGTQNITPGTTPQGVTQGYHDGSGSVAGDADLTAGNIKSGVTIFGQAGSFTGIGGNVQDTSSGNAVAADILSGKKAWVDGLEVIGILNPPPVCSGTLNGTRWCVNGDGTVTDMTSGLVWLKNADCFGESTWENAIMKAGTLFTLDCGLSDGSYEGWRLPTRDELYGLANGTEAVRDSTPRAFSDVRPYGYWSSTTIVGSTGEAWLVSLPSGDVVNFGKAKGFIVWPVRGG